MYFSLLSYVFLSKDEIPKTSPSPNHGERGTRICTGPLSASFSDASVKSVKPPLLQHTKWAHQACTVYFSLSNNQCTGGLQTL